jgi:hypothetical protein
VKGRECGNSKNLYIERRTLFFLYMRTCGIFCFVPSGLAERSVKHAPFSLRKYNATKKSFIY